ncbi:MAG: serine/threonine-protein kinase, partial [Myxococcota bacterium]
MRLHDPELDRTVAAKILRATDPASVARFEAEARTTAQLQHPGVVPVYRLDTAPDGRRRFTMAEVRGRTLLDVIRDLHAARDRAHATTPDGWTLFRLVAAFEQVCATIAYAHGRGVIHRDLKPANLMIGRFGEVYVVDWGLVRADPVEPATGDAPIRPWTDPDAARTADGAVLGTPAYMAPEQARGAPATSAADVFALGAVLYTILAGRPPLVGPADEVLRALLADAPI